MTRKPTGTAEWAKYSHNDTVGCENGCLYCYARAAAIRRDPFYKDHWNRVMTPKEPEGKRSWRRGKLDGTVMYPTQHDITDANIAWAIDTLKGMLSAGNQVLIVSKPKGSLIWTLVEALAEWKDQILFRFTIGAMDDTILRFWEPGAPDFNNRFASLQIAHSNGFATSVSMEPMLETELDDIQDLVDTLNPYVTDSIWLGKANKLIERLGENGFTDEIHAIWAHRLMESQTDERILELYDRMKDYDKIKWKESIKAVVGIEAPAEIGMDV